MTECLRRILEVLGLQQAVSGLPANLPGRLGSGMLATV